MRFDGKNGFAFVVAAARRRLRGGERGQELPTRCRPGAWPSSPRACPKARTSSPTGEPGKAALGWLLAPAPVRRLSLEEGRARARRRACCVTGEAARIDETVRLAEATALVRDLVNTPAADLGPAELEQAVRDEAKRLGAQVRVTAGEELAEGYPLIAAVGGAATRGARAAPDRARMGQGRATRASRSSARASASTAAGSTSSRPAACG